MSNICSICNEPSSLITDDEVITVDGQPITVHGLSFYECPSCSEMFVDVRLDTENSIIINKAKMNQ